MLAPWRTLLIIIAALCRMAKLDWKDRGVAQRIQKVVDESGAAVTDDTISKYLKQIPDALEARSK